MSLINQLLGTLQQTPEIICIPTCKHTWQTNHIAPEHLLCVQSHVQYSTIYFTTQGLESGVFVPFHETVWMGTY
jgi:hypothetical protein